MSLPPERIVPDQQMFAEALGIAPARGRLRGRRILVVGAGQRPSTSIRRSATAATISVLCAREGASLACVDISREAAEQTCAQIHAEGGQAFAEIADVADADAIAPLVERCAARLGGLDGLVMVVGVTKALPLAKQDARGWDYEFAVNVRSNMLFAQKALELMDDGASMVLMSSLAALRNSSGMPGYETSKAAGRACAQHRHGRAGQGHTLQRGAAGSDGHAHGSRRHARARGARGHAAALRPPGHRLGSGLRDPVSAIQRIVLC